jgi:hypothetical protein
VSEQCGNQQATNAPIAVEERVNRFELRMDEGNGDQRRQRRRLGVNEAFQFAQQLVGDFFHIVPIVQLDACFLVEQVRQCRLCSLNL